MTEHVGGTGDDAQLNISGSHQVKKSGRGTAAAEIVATHISHAAGAVDIRVHCDHRNLLLHKLIAQETGGSIGLRDEALLDSALENAFAGFDGQDFYPTKEEKGARLGYTLISNHAFVDGNKRIGMYVMLTFLEVNGIHMECTNEEVVEVGLSVASGTMDYDALLQWVRDHRI